MLSRIKSLLGALRAPNQSEREMAYLREAVSLYDIECRERQIDMGLFRPRAIIR